MLPNSTHHNQSDYQHSGVVSDENESDSLISGRLAAARVQLQEARREIDPNARIDRVITALDELLIGLEQIEGGSAPTPVGGIDQHHGQEAAPTTHNSGGCG